MNKYIILVLFFLLVLPTRAQNENVENYRRSSLYSMLITHPSRTFSGEIKDVFFSIPIPDKFNDHSLSVKTVESDTKKEEEQEVINAFIQKNALARRMVGKWFDRDPEVGIFDMDLIAARGYYDANFFDVNLAKKSVRGVAQLADAGEELLGNTFLLVNDIKYLDKSQATKNIGAFVKILGAAASAYTGNSDYADLANTTGNLIESIKGFKVTVTSYLYRLDWNDDIANQLYQSYYMTQNDYSSIKKAAFDDCKDLFKLKFIGKQSVNSGQTSIQGVNLDSPEQMIRKVCTRAIDKSIVELQQAHEEFRVKTPIYKIGANIQAKIGMKEGVSVDSKFEVLETLVDKDGKTQYKRVGVIKPVSGKIWDNRYMAVEERAEGANLICTEFKKVSGSDFRVGMLIREIK